VKAQPEETEPIAGDEHAALEKPAKERSEDLQPTEESAQEDTAELEVQRPEQDGRNFDDEPPFEVAEGDVEPGQDVEMPDQPEESSFEPEAEPEPEVPRQPEPERPARFERRPPERQERREFGRRRQDQRPQRVQESRPPEPPRERVPATPAAVHEAIDLVTQVIDNLRESLEDMEEVLETLEFAERQKTADEQEIESLRRMLKQMHRPREGGSQHNPPPQHRGR